MNNDNRVAAAMAGDIAAFGLLYDEYRSFVYNVAYRMTTDYGDAEDITQEVFVSVWKKLPTFRGNSAFSSWLYRIAINRTLTWTKQRRDEKPLAETMTLPDNNRPERFAEQNEASDILDRLLAKLGPDRRMVLVLREIEGFSYDEIAMAVEAPVGTVRSRLNRARKDLEEIAATMETRHEY